MTRSREKGLASLDRRYFDLLNEKAKKAKKKLAEENSMFLKFGKSLVPEDVPKRSRRSRRGSK